VTALFVLAAVVTVAAAVAVIAAKDLVRAVMALALMLLGTAVLYALLSAPFLAGVQVLTYVGGVVTLMVFGVMVTRRHEGAQAPAEHVGRLRGLLVAGGLFALLAWAVVASDLERSTVAPVADADSTRTLARALLDDQLVAFEAVSLLLLAAIVGAVALARRNDDRPATPAAARSALPELANSSAHRSASSEPLVGSGAREGGP
jgi:NADH-quinone oxidoreductase subunit J